MAPGWVPRGIDTLAAGGRALPPREPRQLVDLTASLEASVRYARRARAENLR